MKMLKTVLALPLLIWSFCGAQWVVIEAEKATLSGSATISNDASASGSQYVNIGTNGRIDFTINVSKADNYLLKISNKGSSAAARSFENMEINGSKVIDQQYAAGYAWDPEQTGHYTGEGELAQFIAFKTSIEQYGDSSDPWQSTARWWSHTGGKRNEAMTVSLNAGENTISIIKNWGGTKWDKIEIDTTYPNRALEIEYSIHTEQDVAPISPYIYGSSVRFNIIDDAITMMRFGGNHTTPYNWENNFTNAGHDWYHNSHRLSWPGDAMEKGRETEPGSIITYHHDRSLARGLTSLIAISMIGYVAADGNGIVTEEQTAPSSRWVRTQYKKNAPFCEPPGNPDTTDGVVYSDELVNYLVSRYGGANSPRGIKFYALDNEPRLWGWNHVRIHPDTLTGGELTSKSKELASAIKDVDPNAKIFGPVFYGIWPMYDLQNKGDWDKIKKNYSWFVDYYLDEMKQASDSYGSRLVDVFTFHYYSHTSTSDTSDQYIQARMQAPRALWDPAYNSNPLLSRIQNSIDTYNPGTGIGITEWSFGGKEHISGGIATADALGIFGKMGLFQSSYWTLSDDTPYPNAAFRLYRNYDGKQSTYGDTKVRAETSDKVSSSLYASTVSSDSEQLHMIVLNKDLAKSISGTFTISSPQMYKNGRVWAFDQNSPTISERSAISQIVDNVFKYTIPPATACHFVLQAEDSPVKAQSEHTITNINTPMQVYSNGKETKMYYTNENSSSVEVSLFDVDGEFLFSLTSAEIAGGVYEIFVDHSSLKKGVYFVKIKMNHKVTSQKIIVN